MIYTVQSLQRFLDQSRGLRPEIKVLFLVAWVVPPRRHVCAFGIYILYISYVNKQEYVVQNEQVTFKENMPEKFIWSRLEECNRMEILWNATTTKISR